MLDLGVIVKCLTFGGRNTDKVLYGSNGQHDEGRLCATVGQITQAGKSATEMAAKLDNYLGKGAQAAVNTMCSAAHHNKVLKYAGKSADWASKHVNPLLVGAAGYRVLVAEDKEAALKKEIFGMSAMFGTERCMKEFLNSKYMKTVHANMHNKYAKTALAVIEGLGFVAGSIAGSTAGYKLGEIYVDKTRKTKEFRKIDLNKLKEELKKVEKLPKLETGLEPEELNAAMTLGNTLLQKEILA